MTFYIDIIELIGIGIVFLLLFFIIGIPKIIDLIENFRKDKEDE